MSINNSSSTLTISLTHKDYITNSYNMLFWTPSLELYNRARGFAKIMSIPSLKTESYDNGYSIKMINVDTAHRKTFMDSLARYMGNPGLFVDVERNDRGKGTVMYIFDENGTHDLVAIGE